MIWYALYFADWLFPHGDMRLHLGDDESFADLEKLDVSLVVFNDLENKPIVSLTVG